MGHYVKYDFQGRLQCICRGGSASRPYHTVSTNHVFVGAVVVLAASTNRFVGVDVVPATSIISVSRGGSI